MHDIALQVLGPGFLLHFWHTVEEASLLLDDQKVNIVVCTMRIDDHHMFDLRKLMRTNFVTSDIPFATVILEDSSILSTAAIDNLFKTGKLVGIGECVNLPQWRQELGEEVAYAKLRARLDQLCIRLQ